MVNFLRSLLGSPRRPESVYRIGDRVKVVSGAFTDFEAVVQDTKRGGVLELDFDMNGQISRVEMKSSEVEKL